MHTEQTYITDRIGRIDRTNKNGIDLITFGYLSGVDMAGSSRGIWSDLIAHVCARVCVCV